MKKRERLASWIYAVAINISISKIRKDCKLEFYESVADFAVAEPSGYEENANYQKLIDALYKLNEVDKSIMLLYLEDFSYEEIAEITGMGASHVGVKIHRLKNQLQKQLKG